MNHALDAARKLLSEWEETKTQLPQQWAERRNTVIESWEKKRRELMESMLENYFAVQNVVCQVCETREGVIRCFDCPKIHLCSSCDITVHKDKALHDRQALLNDFYQSIPPTVALESSSVINVGMRQ